MQNRMSSITAFLCGILRFFQPINHLVAKYIVSQKTRAAHYSHGKRQQLSMEVLEERQLLAATILDATLSSSTNSLDFDFALQVGSSQYAAIDLTAAGIGGFDCGNVVVTNKITGETYTLANQSGTTTAGLLYLKNGNYTLTVVGADTSSAAKAQVKLVYNDSSVNTGSGSSALTTLQEAADLQQQILAGKAPAAAWNYFISQNKSKVEAVYGAGALDGNVMQKWGSTIDVDGNGKFDTTDYAIAQQMASGKPVTTSVPLTGVTATVNSATQIESVNTGSSTSSSSTNSLPTFKTNVDGTLDATAENSSRTWSVTDLATDANNDALTITEIVYGNIKIARGATVNVGNNVTVSLSTDGKSFTIQSQDINRASDLQILLTLTISDGKGQTTDNFTATILAGLKINWTNPASGTISVAEKSDGYIDAQSVSYSVFDAETQTTNYTANWTFAATGSAGVSVPTLDFNSLFTISNGTITLKNTDAFAFLRSGETLKITGILAVETISGKTNSITFTWQITGLGVDTTWTNDENLSTNSVLGNLNTTPTIALGQITQTPQSANVTWSIAQSGENAFTDFTPTIDANGNVSITLNSLPNVGDTPIKLIITVTDTNDNSVILATQEIEFTLTVRAPLAIEFDTHETTITVTDFTQSKEIGFTVTNPSSPTVDYAVEPSSQNIDFSNCFIIENGKLKFDPATLFDQLCDNESVTLTVTLTASDNWNSATTPNAVSFVVTNGSFSLNNTSGAGIETADTITVDLADTITDYLDERDNEITWNSPTLDSVEIDGANWDGNLAGLENCFSIENGIFIFTPNGNFNFLAAGEIATLTFTLTASDGKTTCESILTIKIFGISEPVLEITDFPVSVTESESAVITFTTEDPNGTNNQIDVDYSIDAKFTSENEASQNAFAKLTELATFFTPENGTLTFNPGESFKFLCAGETLTFTVTLIATDNVTKLTTTEIVTFSVTGIASAPIAETTLAGFFENGVVANESAEFVNFYDLLGKSVDAGSAFFVSNMTVKLGDENCVVTFERTGDNWTATIKDSDGKTVGVFTYTAAINGTNDTLTFTPDADYFVTLEKGDAQTLSVSFQITGDNSTDPVDAAEVTFDIIGISEKPTIIADDVTTTESASVSTSVTVTDSNSCECTLTPEIANVTFDMSKMSAASQTEFAKLTNLASFFKLENGTLTFDQKGAFNFLCAGEILTFTVTLTATDNVTGLTATENVTFTVNGEKSAPLAGTTLTLVNNLSVIVGTTNGTTIGQHWQAKLGTSVDAGTSFKVSQMSLTIDGTTYISTPIYVMNGNGSWSATFKDSGGKIIGVFNYVAGNGNFKFTPDVNYFAYLAKDGTPETLTISFQIQGDNGTAPVDLTATATFNVKGISERPNIAVVGTNNVETTESESASTKVTITDSDGKTGTLTPAIVMTFAESGLSNESKTALANLESQNGGLASFFKYESGMLVFDPDGKFDFLGKDEALTFTVTLTATDNITKLLSNTATVTFTITPSAPTLKTNSKPVSEKWGNTDGFVFDNLLANWTHVNKTELDSKNWTIELASSDVYATINGEQVLVGTAAVVGGEIVVTPNDEIKNLKCGQQVSWEASYRVVDSRGVVSDDCDTLSATVTGVHIDAKVTFSDGTETEGEFYSNNPNTNDFVIVPTYEIDSNNVDVLYELGEVSASGTTNINLENVNWNNIISVDGETGAVTIKREAFAELEINENVEIIINIVAKCRGCGDEIGDNLSLTFNISKFDSFAVSDGNNSGDETDTEITVDLKELLEDKVTPERETFNSLSWAEFTAKLDSINGNVDTNLEWEKILQDCFTIDANGVFKFTPKGNFDFLAFGEHAELKFTITVCDTQWNIAHDVIITITVHGEKSAPIANDTITIFASGVTAKSNLNTVENFLGLLGTNVDNGDQYRVSHVIYGEGEDNRYTVTYDTTAGKENDWSVKIEGVGTFSYDAASKKLTYDCNFKTLQKDEKEILEVEFQVVGENGLSADKTAKASFQITGVNTAPEGKPVTDISIPAVFAGTEIRIEATDIAYDVNNGDTLSFVSFNNGNKLSENPVHFQREFIYLRIDVNNGDLLINTDELIALLEPYVNGVDKAETYSEIDIDLIVQDQHGAETSRIKITLFVKGAPDNSSQMQSMMFVPSGDENSLGENSLENNAINISMTMSSLSSFGNFSTPEQFSLDNGEETADDNLAPEDQHTRHGKRADAYFTHGNQHDDDNWFLNESRRKRSYSAQPAKTNHSQLTDEFFKTF